MVSESDYYIPFCKHSTNSASIHKFCKYSTSFLSQNTFNATFFYPAVFYITITANCIDLETNLRDLEAKNPRRRHVNPG